MARKKTLKELSVKEKSFIRKKRRMIRSLDEDIKEINKLQAFIKSELKMLKTKKQKKPKMNNQKKYWK